MADPDPTARSRASDGSEDPRQIDAMGDDKRRSVVGEQYGASARKQLLFYGIFLAVAIVVVIAFLTIVRGIDNREMPLEPTAPWTAAGAELAPPRDIDYMRNGPENTIPRREIVYPGGFNSD